jgi:TRAP-type C4-dicarboxylate transport system permease small subunit
MHTTIVAYVIALVGFVTIAVGAWDIIILLTDAPVEEVSLSDLAIAVGIVAGGFGLIGLAQALRLLVATRWRLVTRSRSVAQHEQVDQTEGRNQS